MYGIGSTVRDLTAAMSGPQVRFSTAQHPGHLHSPQVRLNSTRSVPPVWLIGLSNTTLGFSNEIVFFVMPQLMAAHVPEAKIAAITALASPPGFWSVFFAPALDVRFSRRWYAPLLAALSSTASAAAVISLRHLAVFRSPWSSGPLQLASPVPPSAAGFPT
jgi:hypothetical protein